MEKSSAGMGNIVKSKIILKRRATKYCACFFILGDCYKPNTASENALSFNKVVKDIGLCADKNWFVEIVFGQSNIHFHGILDLGAQCKIKKCSKKVYLHG